jgi:hypothetical protein
MEELIGFVALIWIGFADRMLNPKNPRPKRMIFFLLFYIPLAAVLTWAAYSAYTVKGWWIFSFALYAIAAFLLPFLFEKAWFASRDKERAAFRKTRMRIIRFWIRYKNRMMNKKNKLILRIVLFVLLFLPFYVIPGLLMLVMRSALPLIMPFMWVIAILTLASAIIVFTGKKRS